jgi:protein-S-isoprenylcysteine O-methyltransferase Ste14
VKPYQRFFGGAPAGWAICLALLWLAFRLQPVLALPAIHGNRDLGFLVLAVTSVLSLALSTWTHLSLPPWFRGKKLVTTGAFKYLRHPIYASFLIFFVGFAFWLDQWIFMLWAVVQLPIWYLSAVGEEKLMRQDFPEYDEYCRRTQRFIPGIW